MVGRAGVTAAVAKRVPTRSRRSRWARVGAYPRTDDPRRDGKLAAFVLHMTTRTKLVFGSIEQYVWGVRAWMQSRRRPPDGCALLDVVIKVSSYQGAHLGAIIDLVEAKYLHDLFAVQMVFLILVLYYSFSRTECPCPKTYAGRECFDSEVHWGVRDFDIRSTAGVRALWVRFRAIKQDPRVERPAARGSGDWACIGDVPDTKWSPIKWYTRLAQLHGAPRDPFVDKSDVC